MKPHDSSQPAFESEFKTLKVYLHGFESDSYELNGESVNYQMEDIRLIEPVTEFDPLPQREKRNYVNRNLKVIETGFSDSELTITWK